MSTKNGTAGKPPVETELILALVEPSPLNPRKKFDADKLAELTASVKLHGVLQPILVWKPVKGERRYEVIAGERRLRAARDAGLATIPAKVLDVTEKEAREIRIIENDQREDLTVLERAEGYAELVEKHGYTVETLAERIGKSANTVRDFLKIARQLPRLARDAVDAGRIPTSTAGLIARVPGEEAREEVTRFVLSGYSTDDGPAPTDSELKKAQKEDRPPLGIIDTKELIRTRYMRQLKQAPFSRADPDLLPAAGSCEACPKRTGNNREDFPDARADVCTDPACFADKMRAYHARLLQRHQEAGRPVLSASQAKEMFPFDKHRLGGDASVRYVDLAEQCYEPAVAGGGYGESWKKLVGAQLDSEIVVVQDPGGQVHELVPRAAALKALPKKPRAAVASDSAAEARQKREQAAERAKQQAGKEAARRANGLVAEAMQSAFGVAIGFPPAAVEQVRAFVRQLGEVCWSDACRQVRLRRTGKEAGQKTPGGDRDAIEELVAQAQSVRELMGIAAELVAARASLQWHADRPPIDKREDEFFRAFGVDRKKLLKAATADRKEKRQEKKARKKAAKAAQAKSAQDDGADDGADDESESSAYHGIYIGDLWDDVDKAKAAIERAYIADKFVKRITAPEKVCPFVWPGPGGSLWVNSGGVGQYSHSSYEVLPLHPIDEFKRTYPNRALRLQPCTDVDMSDEERDNFYFGVRVTFKGTEYAIGPKASAAHLTTKAPGTIRVSEAAQIVEKAAAETENPVVKERLKGIADDLNGVPRAETDNAPLYAALHRALHATQGAAERWAALAKRGVTDAQLKMALGGEWQGGPGHAGDGCHYSTRGGKEPYFWFDANDVTSPFGKPTLAGKALLGAVRKLLGIGTEPAPQFCIGMEVLNKVNGRAGRITGRKSGGPDRIELWFVEWNKLPGQKKGESGYMAADSLLPGPNRQGDCAECKGPSMALDEQGRCGYCRVKAEPLRR